MELVVEATVSMLSTRNKQACEWISTKSKIKVRTHFKVDIIHKRCCDVT